MLQRLKNEGLTGFQIKIIALILMVLDHIYYFFEFTGKVPLIFTQLGRLSANLFLFMVIEGFYHTSNRKKYFLRVYIAGVLMGIVKFIIMYEGFFRGDGFFPENGIFATFAIILIILQGIDWIKEKKRVKGILLTIFPFVINAIIILLYNILPKKFIVYIIFFINTILPIPFNCEGSIGFIIAGILLYIFRNNRKKQMIAFIASTIIWYVGLAFIMGATVVTLFTLYFEWLGIFAAFIMCLYNGKKGKSAKGLFYIFYPAHIYLFYIISIWVFAKIH